MGVRGSYAEGAKVGCVWVWVCVKATEAMAQLKDRERPAKLRKFKQIKQKE